MNFSRYRLTCGLFYIVIAISPPACYAHFLWLKTFAEGGQPQAFLFFGENALDEAYHLPERLAKTEVWRRMADGKRSQLETKSVETDDRIGLVAPLAGDGACVLEATRQYGIYGKSLLVYHAKHIHADSSERLNAAGRTKDLKLEIVPKAEGGQFTLSVYWQGEPLPGAKVNVAVGDAEAVEKTTDEQGRVSVKLDGDGLVSALANHLDKQQSGELEGKPYSGALHYSSLTLERPNSTQKPGGGGLSTAKPQAALPPLPEPVSSFGAVVEGGWLYVYSGHTGEEHEHSAANLSKHFRRIKLDGSMAWQELPMQTPLQGLPLVAHGGKIYRVGGLEPRNPTTKDKEDLHSTAEFAEFDPATGKWQSLAPLPTPRSSHNAVVIGDRLYVVGGWQLHGKSPGDWQTDALAYDFAKPQAAWQKLPKPPFKRRALAAAEWHGKLVAIGGMNAKGKVSQRVDVFDPANSRWSRGPDLPGTGMAGFGGAACTAANELYASGLRGVVYRLNDTGSAWEEAARLDKPRFFHQLLSAGNGGLLAVGGASRRGHLADIEWIDVNRSATAATRKSPDTAATTPDAAEVAKHAAGKTGVLLVSHGSHSPHWRRMLLALQKDVAQQVLALPGIDGLRSAFMEYTEPSIATQLKAFDREGYQHVILVPLLLTVSSHSFDDIPTIIGAKEDAKSLAFMAAEGIERYAPRAEVAVAPLLDFSALLEKNLPRRIARLSKDPADEGVVLVAYGSEPYNEEWEAFFNDLGAVVKRQTGVAVVKHCWCGHVVRYQQQPTKDAIRAVLGEAQRAIVIPVLVAYDETFQDRIIGEAVENVEDTSRVAYVPDAILPEPALNEWIVSVTQQIYQTLRNGNPILKGE